MSPREAPATLFEAALGRLGDVLTPGSFLEATPESLVVAEAGGFTPVELWTRAWEQPGDPDRLVARAESVSVVGSLPPADKERVLDRVRHLADTHPDLAGRARFPFPYTTRVYRCRRR